MSGRCSAAASCFLIGAIVRNSPLWARYARRASPTYSLRSWEITQDRYKEQPDEYSIQRYAGVLRFAGDRASNQERGSTFVLVGAAGIVGEPFHLHRATGRGSRHAVRIPHRHHGLRHVDDRPGAAACGSGKALQLRYGADHGDSFYRLDLLLARGAAQRASRPQHFVLEVAAG